MTHFQSFYQGGTCFQPAVPSFHPPESKTIENQNGVCQAFAFDVMKKLTRLLQPPNYFQRGNSL